jgi:methionyl-tRNA synthetase
VHDVGIFPRMDKASFFAAQGEDAEGKPADVKASAAPASANAAPAIPAPAGAAPAGKGPIAIDDFAKVSLMAARVRAAKRHPGADKLLVLELEDGGGTTRTICAGIAAWYEPESLVGKTLVIVANLAPRKLRGIESQGMVLAGSTIVDGVETVRVVELPSEVQPGSEVR